jgi:outer membrane protein assembly factor BamB
MAASIVLPDAARASTGSPSVSTSSGQDATAYQMNPGHTGASSDPVGPQWTSSWTKNLGGQVSYPLIADGQVFVLADSSTPTIYAFDASTGTVDWTVDPVGGSFGIAYDAGRIFEQSADEMYAYDALTGQLEWSTPLSYQFSLSAPPTAANGIVYSNSFGGGAVYAFSETTGAVLWTEQTASGGEGSPAVGASGVYLTGGCDDTSDDDPSTGARLWVYNTGCGGGGGETPVLAHGYLYLSDVVLSAATGAVAGSLVAGAPPAVDGSNIYLTNDGALSAQTVTNGRVLWTFDGDGQLYTSPIVDDGVVYVGSQSGELYGVSAATGQLLWSTDVATPIGTTNDESSFSGLAEGDGLLVVPAEDTLTVFDDPFARPSAPSGVSASVSGTTASVTWTVPADNSDAIDSFTITPTVNGTALTPYVIPAGAVGSATDPTPDAVDTYTLTGLSAGDSDTFTVAADNGGGRGPSTTAAFAPTITSAPSGALGLGQPGSVTVTTTGVPAPSLQETGTLPGGVTFVDNGDGTATLSGTATGALTSYPITITATNDAGTVSQGFVLSIVAPIVFSGAAATTFTVGSSGSFTFEASGTPRFAESGPLPGGVVLTPGGWLVGAPWPGTDGTYPMTVTATNGVAPATSESFVLTVDGASAITSVPSTAFVVRRSNSFTVTTSGNPTAVVQESGALPAGVSFTDNGDGTATLTGTPAAGTLGPYPIVITAENGVGVAATQNFLLTVGVAPVITSSAATTFTVGSPGSFAFHVTGSPAPVVAETGPLPAGVTLSEGGALAGTPAAGTAGSYPLTVVAANGVAPSATQNFVLTVASGPAFTSTSADVFVGGTPGVFTVTASGSPVPAISESGALPSGVTLTDNGNGTATLAGTAPADLVGSYPITLTATNGFGTAAVQNFVLTLGVAPVITSAAAATFTAGQPGTFTFQGTGLPTPTFSVSAGLPPGVTMASDGSGLVGTPAFGTGGIYVVLVTASNGLVPIATQTFTLTVDDAPTITSGAINSFLAGQPDSMTITAAGLPRPTLQESGALPSGVTFTDDGDGAAILSGTPAADAYGVYHLTITADNGIDPDATQTLNLDVYQPLIFTNSPTTSFSPGASGSFSFAVHGQPPPTYSEIGALPTGVSLAAAGTLAGTPAAGTQGTYPITVAAENGLTVSFQNFVLYVGMIITTTTLPPGARKPYRATLTVVGGNAPYRWSVVSGALPPGLHLHGPSGVISGRPTKAGSYTFTVEATGARAKRAPHTRPSVTASESIVIS